MVIYRAGAVLGFECERAWCGNSPARLPASLAPATRSRRRRAAYQSKDREEAVVHVPNTLVSCEDHVQQRALCWRMCFVGSPARSVTSPTRRCWSSELGWATKIMNESFFMSMAQLQPAAALVIMLDTHRLRHIGAAASRWPARSRRAAAATRRSARGPHAPGLHNTKYGIINNK